MSYTIGATYVVIQGRVHCCNERYSRAHAHILLEYFMIKTSTTVHCGYSGVDGSVLCLKTFAVYAANVPYFHTSIIHHTSYFMHNICSSNHFQATVSAEDKGQHDQQKGCHPNCTDLYLQSETHNDATLPLSYPVSSGVTRECNMALRRYVFLQRLCIGSASSKPGPYCGAQDEDAYVAILDHLSTPYSSIPSSQDPVLKTLYIRRLVLTDTSCHGNFPF